LNSDTLFTTCSFDSKIEAMTPHAATVNLVLERRKKCTGSRYTACKIWHWAHKHTILQRLYRVYIVQESVG